MKLMKRKGTYKKGDGLKKVIMEAKKHWHKVKRGGDGNESGTAPVNSAEQNGGSSSDEDPPTNAEGGRRRRRGRKTRRRRHH